ncbi:MAG: alpha/beta hydrolase family protein [Actinomycetota bacterium]
MDHPAQREPELVEERLPVVVDGLRLRGRAYVPSDAQGLVLLLHGIPSTTPPDPDDEGYPGVARRLAAKGFAAAWVDMRAARSSPGYFSIRGWVRDATGALFAATSLQGVPGPVAIVGSSAGGAVATEVARGGAPVAALALLAAPAAWVSFAGDPREGLRRITEEAGMAVAPEVLSDPTAWAEEFDEVSTERSIGRLTCPVLIVHSSDDDVVPVDHAKRIAERARRPELRILDGAGHQLRRDERALDLVTDFLRRNLK